MALTFRGLVDQADFSSAKVAEAEPEAHEEEAEEETHPPPSPPADAAALSLRHDVHIHLPISDDIKVYDAIFRSIRENLLY